MALVFARLFDASAHCAYLGFEDLGLTLSARGDVLRALVALFHLGGLDIWLVAFCSLHHSSGARTELLEYILEGEAYRELDGSPNF